MFVAFVSNQFANRRGYLNCKIDTVIQFREITFIYFNKLINIFRVYLDARAKKYLQRARIHDTLGTSTPLWF